MLYWAALISALIRLWLTKAALLLGLEFDADLERVALRVSLVCTDEARPPHPASVLPTPGGVVRVSRIREKCRSRTER